MTDPMPSARKQQLRFLIGRATLCVILLVAALPRIDRVGFGLPALNGPDEPLFMATTL
jgi:hypothetical protein